MEGGVSAGGDEDAGGEEGRGVFFERKANLLGNLKGTRNTESNLEGIERQGVWKQGKRGRTDSRM